MSESNPISSLVLEKGKASLELLPQAGGAVKSWYFDQKEILCPRKLSASAGQESAAIAAYPLVPYVGPIAQGRFSFGDQDYQLKPNREGLLYPVDGNGWENPWKLGHKTESHAILFFDFKADNSNGPDPHWPFAYRAVVSYVLHEKSLEIELVLENRDDKTQPVGLGFRPFLPVGQETRLSFQSEGGWSFHDGDLSVAPIPCEGDCSFASPEPLYGRALDHVFTKFGGEALLKRGDGNPDIRITADPIFTHMAVFSPQGEGFAAISPVSMMADGFNHPEMAGRGVQILKPRQRIGGTMRFTLCDG